MAAKNKNVSENASGKNGANKPRKTGGALLVLFLILVSAVVTLYFVSPAARGQAHSLFTASKALAASVLDGVRRVRADGRPASGGDATLKMLNNLAAKFTALEMRSSDYSIQHFPKDSAIEVRATVPRGRPVEWIVWKLAAAADETPYVVDDGVCPAPARCVVTFRSANARHPKITMHLQQAGRYLTNTAMMAILVENFGFEADQTTIEYLSFPEPLTVSLAPTQRLAAWTAQIADEYKKEVVLLLPMEPLPQQFGSYRPLMITIHQSEDAIRNIIAQAAAAVPNFSGVSNFHGSRVMEDSRVMGIILSEVNRRKAYFVYTDNSRKSVVPQLVRENRVPSHPIQGTIDAEHTAEQARERLRGFAVRAERTGRMLVRVQPSQAFIQVLKEETDALRRNGIRLVYVSELM